MKFIIPNAKVTLEVSSANDSVTVKAGEIQLPGKTWVLPEDFTWKPKEGLQEASGYLADLDGKLVLLVDEVETGELPFDPNEVPARPLWLIFQARKVGSGMEVLLHEPVSAPVPPPPPVKEKTDG